MLKIHRKDTAIGLSAALSLPTAYLESFLICKKKGALQQGAFLQKNKIPG